MNLLVDGSFLSIPGANWAGFLLDLVFKSTAILTAVYLTGGLMRRWRAALRSRIWTLVFSVVLLLPLFSVVSLQVDLAGLESPIVSVVQFTTPAGEDPADGASRPAAGIAGVTTPAAAVPDKVSVAPGGMPAAVSNQVVFRHWAVFVVLWLMGTAWCAVRTVRRFYAGLSAGQSARPVTSKLFDDVKRLHNVRRTVELRISEAVPSPFVTGLKKCYVVLPAAFAGWEEADLRAVFQHELAHIRRRDLLRLIVYRLVCAIYWFNPLAWTAARRAALDAEMACDDAVCGNDGPALGYARRLLWLAGQASAASDPVGTPGMSDESGVEQRIKYLLDPRTRPPAKYTAARKAAAVVTPALVALMSLAAVTLQVVATGDRIPLRPVETSAGHADETAREPACRQMTDDDLLAGLFAAAEAGDVEAINNMLDRNPGFLDAQTRRGMTPLALAAWNDHLGAVEYLLSRGADPDIKNHNGLTPLFCAVDRSRYAMARLLVRGGADLSTRGYYGRTLLHMAARSGDAGLARTLIDRGASVNTTDVRGVTPLDLAAWHQKQSVASILNSHGAVRSPAEPPTFMRKKHLKKTV